MFRVCAFAPANIPICAGMLMTVFSNATLIDEEIVAVFRELPPQAVDISIYGATQETYEKITRVPG